MVSGRVKPLMRALAVETRVVAARAMRDVVRILNIGLLVMDWNRWEIGLVGIAEVVEWIGVEEKSI
jgi:hypothetical protein